MKWLRSLLLVSAISCAADDARADDSTGKTVMEVGGAVFGAGYAPVAALGAPSAVGFVGRFYVLLLTVGLPCVGRDDDPDAPPPPPKYLCDGTHGAAVLLIPLAGPFLYAHTHDPDSVTNPNGAPLSTFEKDLLYTSGAMQAAGALMVIVGAAIAASAPPKRSADTSKQEGPRFLVLPSVTTSSVGITASVMAW